MTFLSVTQFAQAHGLSERTVRNYCVQGKIEEATLVGSAWSIPSDAALPVKNQRRSKCKNALLIALRTQKSARLRGGIYHHTQIELTYNSNHIEGSQLTHEQTRCIYETRTIGLHGRTVRIDDIVETSNHFRCIDFVIDHAEKRLSENLIKELHRLLKNGTSDADKKWFNVGDYKQLPNEVGGMETCAPENVRTELRNLLADYNAHSSKSLEEIIDFHHKFERIHPFQDGNGRVGRLILFKECLRNNIVPFIITDNLKWFYYRGLSEWNHIRNYLIDTCLAAQDNYKSTLDYFRIPYND